MTIKTLLVLGALAALLAPQKTPPVSKWPLNPVRYPPTRAETDLDDHPDVPGWDGGEFEAAGVAWRAAVANEAGLTPEQRKHSNYRICVIDRGPMYHVFLLPKEEDPRSASFGGNRRGASAMVVVYKKPMAAKYITGQP